jgi:hypothetical protein
MKTIQMLVDNTGSDDGLTVSLFKKDQVYKVCDDLANNFVNREFPVAIFVEEAKQEMPKVKEVVDQAEVKVEVEEKKLDEPENKMLEKAPQNKASKKGK